MYPSLSIKNNDALKNFRIFHASTKPAYLIARFQTKYNDQTKMEGDYVSVDDDSVEMYKNFYHNELKNCDPLVCSFSNSLREGSITSPMLPSGLVQLGCESEGQMVPERLCGYVGLRSKSKNYSIK